jgi:hypothetical protein
MRGKDPLCADRFLSIHCIVAHAGCKSETPIEWGTLGDCDEGNPNFHQKRALGLPKEVSPRRETTFLFLSTDFPFVRLLKAENT